MGDKIQTLLCGEGLKESERLKAVLDYLDSIEGEYVYCMNEVAIENKRLQDYLHFIEFEKTCEARSKACTEFRKQRLHRRKCKDRAGELEPILEVLHTKECQRVINHLKQALGSVRKQEKYERERQYHPRVKE